MISNPAARDFEYCYLLVLLDIRNVWEKFRFTVLDNQAYKLHYNFHVCITCKVIEGTGDFTYALTDLLHGCNFIVPT